MVKEIDGVVYDTEQLDGYEICSHWPMFGRGGYGILYKKDGEFLYESGVCDEESFWEMDLMKMTEQETKDYVKDYGEDCWGLNIEDELDELIKKWKEIFGEEITEW